MATVQLKAPDPFDFRNPDDWPRWRKRFEQFRIASGLASDEGPRQVSTLLYCMGEDADGVLSSTNVTGEERKTYNTVVEKFNEFFQVRRNVIFERARFNRRQQRDGESVEQYITALYGLIETCNYDALAEEMLRDRIVVGIKDQALSESLQTDRDLTLDKVKRRVRQKEAVKEQHKELQGDGSPQNPIVIDRVESGKPGGKGGTKGAKPRGAAGSAQKGAFRSSKAAVAKQPQGKQQCKRCGRTHGKDAQCPAWNVTCFKCNRKGHFGAQCLSKTVANVVSETEETAFLFPVSTSHGTSWSIDLQVGHKQLSFKLDTGAEVTAISERSYNSLGRPPLASASRILYGPTSQPLQVMGQISIILSYDSRCSRQTQSL